MDELSSGEILEIQATDRGAKNDLVAWASSGGHELLSDKEENGFFTFYIKKS